MQKISLSLALTSFLVIIFLMQPLSQMVAVTANPYSYIKPNLVINSPNPANTEIYQTTSMPIEVIVYPGQNTTLVDIFYILDGGPNIKLNLIRYENSVACYGRGTLDNLTDGYHTLRAFSHDAQGNLVSDYQGKILSCSLTFLVNTTFRYPTLLLSPMNSTYNFGEEVPLTYTIDDSKYIAYYQIDNSGQTRLTGNTTLTGLSQGQHTITAHASDQTGTYAKQTANFTIETFNRSPTAAPTVPELSWLAIVPLMVSVLFIAITVRLRKKSKVTVS
jgi:hypothetical protein